MCEHSHVHLYLKPLYRIVRTEDEDSVILCVALCLPVLSYGAERALLLPAAADGDADMVSLDFNWKVKRLPGLPLNQYIFGMMVLIKSCENK